MNNNANKDLETKNLDSFEKNELIQWFLHQTTKDETLQRFFYQMTAEQRSAMTTRYPEHYNKLIGEDVMHTMRRPHVCSVCKVEFTGTRYAAKIKGNIQCHDCYRHELNFRRGSILDSTPRG